MDGNWKLTFPHCMYPIETTVPGLPGINYPDVCENQPVSSKHAFCSMHHKVATEKKVPTDIQGFIRYCGGKAKLGIYFDINKLITYTATCVVTIFINLCFLSVVMPNK